MIDVVLCDDHGMIRSGIQRVLERTSDLRLRASTSTGEELMRAIEEFRPALAVVDIRLPDGSGLDLLRQIGKVSPETRVVMLSMYGASGYVEKAKAGGAKGYVTKECLEDELIGVLRAVMRDEGFVSLRPQDSDSQASKDTPEADIDVLSSRELEVLRLVASGLTNAEVAEKIHVSPRTVESHRASMQRKLMLRTRAELVRLARDAGLVD